MGKIKGIEITDLRVGTGTEATQDNCVAVNVRMFLRRGDEVPSSPAFGPRKLIALWRRDSIAGLLKGIPGVRVGGLRQIVISPHLAYGEAGIPGRIPPNALLRCEVELIAIREHTALLPEDYVPGKLLRVIRPNSQKYGAPHWTFDMHENGNSMLTFRMPNSENDRWCQTSILLDSEKSGMLMHHAINTPAQIPDECILWGSGRLEILGGGRPVREKATQVPCITINISEGNERILDYAVPETSEKFLHSLLVEALREIVTPLLNPPAEPLQQK